MPVTTLDANTALIVIDLQRGIVGLPAIHPIEGVIRNAAALAAAFRARGLPVVLVTVDAAAPGRTEQPPRLTARPDGWTDLVPALDRQPGDILITKRSWDAFTTTDLAHRLTALGVTQVVIAGVSTSAGVESTARHAHALGLHVTLATNAMTDMNAEAHHNSTTRIFPRLGETGDTAEILALLHNGAE